MKVGVNLCHLVPGETGGAEVYARRLVEALLALDSRLELVLFASRETSADLSREPWASAVTLAPLRFNGRRRPERVVAEQTVLPLALRRLGLDLLHNVSSFAPALPGVPQVTTILDLIYRRFPETHSGVLARGVGLLVPLAARRSRRVIALSEAAKRDIVDLLGVPAERVDVTYVGPGMREVDPTPERVLRERFDLGTSPLVLTVSAKRPHKNLERLFEAFGRVQLEPEPLLFVPGYATSFEAALRRKAESAAPGRIRFSGWLAEEDLEGLYRAASCFVFPSLAEGFGLPVLEALVRGVPVACSDVSSIPEVAGDAAIYFDPTDSAAIAAAIECVLSDRDLRERLRRLGPARARLFSWEETARRTVDSYRHALA
jgi:glycosyltransferase involved in cell wall biosynthesis